MKRLTPILLMVLAAWTDGRAGADEAGLLPADRPIEQIVDHYIDAGLKKNGVQPAAPADDAAILRRTTLDLAGRIPTMDELAGYLADTRPDKRQRLVDRLMASPDFIRHQTQELVTLLQLPQTFRRRAEKTGLRDYLTASVAAHRPWDQVFRDLMLPDDADPHKRGASEFLRDRVKDINRLTIDVSTIFFGVNISCAQCHDHPHVPDWKQDHFYGMKSFFARTFEKKGQLGERDTGLVKYIPNKGKEKIAPVMFLTGLTVPDPPASPAVKAGSGSSKQAGTNAKAKEARAPALPKVSLRSKLVEIALEPSQRDFFARAVVNRTWHRVFGRGLVMPLDQMHSANPPSHPELLRWLARDLVAHRYDLHRLLRGLVLSTAYARDSRWPGGDPPPEALFAVAPPRPLTPAQMALSLRIATLPPHALPADPGVRGKRLAALAKGAEKFAKYFPQPADHFQVGVSEALLFANNAELRKELLEGTETLPAYLSKIPELSRRADVAVRSVLSRPIRPEEISALTSYLQGREDRPLEACRQMVWALLASAEFRFNH
jgi:uncharacterized protein DUF1549/uncharacterized protein DUF1553